MPDKRYYSLVKEGSIADITIYGDITSWPWYESDVSSYNLSKVLDELTDVDQINVNINSYGGEVAEGLAIYNALRRHKAHVRTVCDGFACSIASVIFMAGDERIVSGASLLMIHNAWLPYASGNASDLRKQADDLDVITSASKQAYMSRISISEEELTALMDEETWIKPDDALRMGFATEVSTYQSERPSQSARTSLFRMISQAIDDDDDADGANPDPDDADGSDPDSDDVDDRDGQGGGSDGDDPGDDSGEGGDADDSDEDSEDDENQPNEAASLAAFILSGQSKF